MKFEAYWNMVKIATRMKEVSKGKAMREIEYLKLRMGNMANILTLNSDEAVRPDQIQELLADGAKQTSDVIATPENEAILLDLTLKAESIAADLTKYTNIQNHITIRFSVLFAQTTYKIAKLYL